MKTGAKRRPKEFVGKEVIEIQPVILGGSPTDHANKTIVNREDHIQSVRYWNKVITELRRNSTTS